MNASLSTMRTMRIKHNVLHVTESTEDAVNGCVAQDILCVTSQNNLHNAHPAQGATVNESELNTDNAFFLREELEQCSSSDFSRFSP